MPSFSNLLVHDVRTEMIERVAALGSDPLIANFCTQVQSTNRDENYPVAGETPALEEFEDEIPIKSFADGTVNLINREFGAGFEIRKADYEDDKTGALKMRYDEFSEELAEQRRALVLEALVGTTAGYDGVSFFNDAHPIRGDQTATQDNNLAGTGTTTAAVSTDIGTAISSLMSFKGESGRVYNKSITKLGIIAHPYLRRAIEEAVNSVLISNTSNVQGRGIEIVPVYCGELADQDNWYAFNLSRALKPVILQSRVAGEITDEEIKRRAAWAFYCRVRNAAMMSKWALGVKFTN